MSIKYDSMAYENPWRPNYELQAAAVWFMAFIVCLGVQQLTHMPVTPFYWMGGVCIVMAIIRLPDALNLNKLQKHLKGRPLEFITMNQLAKIIKKKQKYMWFGLGFVWENRHAQRIFEITKRDWSDIVDNSLEKAGNVRGQPWIHGVEPNEENIFQALGHSEGQNLILGTTGAGKTRLFDLLVSQAVMRGECVIIIDPKGDKELRENARRACEAAGTPEKFAFFHPGFPEDSIRLDTLRNFTRVTQIASRVSALIPSEAGADPFKSFGWQAINNITQALVIAGERPNLIKLKRFLESGTQQMVIKATSQYAIDHLENGVQSINEIRAASANKNPGAQAKEMLRFYYSEIQPVKPSPELEGLLSMYEHDKTHFGKMVANLIPIMNMLTAGDMGALLSPDYEDIEDDRPILDSKKIIDNGMVVYIGLDSLTDDVVGSAIGSIALADLVAVAGDRYNYEDDPKTVNIFVDEAAEIINKPTIQLLNKGRGAKMKLFVATQTIADFEARLGSEAETRQVLGNMNNLYALRTIDTVTQEFIAENFPKTRLKHVMRTQGNSTNSETPMMHSANTGERLMEEEGDMVPSQLLGMLPDLEFIAKTSGGNIIKGRLPILTN